MSTSAYRTAPLPGNSAQALAASFPVRVLFFLAIHIPIALLVQRSPLFATLHALLLPALGIFVLLRDQEPHRVMYVVGYMVTAESLWRLRTTLNFEYDKYAVGILLVLALLKYGRERKLNMLPALYFALLIPAIYFMPFFDREVVAFNLAGPALLAVSALFFSIVRLDQRQLRRLLIAMLAPIISIATIALVSTLTTENIVFTGGTNPFTSGGDGGNQISAILGLGAVLAYMLVPLFRGHRVLQLLMIAATIDLLAQSAFTFSRGGLYTAVIALVIFALYSLRDQRLRLILILALPVVSLVISTLVFPALNEFSGGVLYQRLQSVDVTGRDRIARQDIELFLSNPIRGIGLGETVEAHAAVFRTTQPHTEVTRMLAEHGLAGLVALLILAWLALKRVLRSDTSGLRLYAITFIAWSVVTTLHIATRVAAPSLLFGLGAMAFFVQETAVAPEPTPTPSGKQPLL